MDLVHEASWSRLLDRMATGDVVPLVGADLMLDPATGQDFYGYLASQLRVGLPGLETAPQDSDLAQLAGRYIKSTSDFSGLYGALKHLTQLSEFSLPQTLRLLAGIRGFKLFLSTTFDDLLLQALREEYGTEPHRGSFSCHSHPTDLPQPWGEKRPFVYSLYGTHSGPDFAVTEEDLLEYTYRLVRLDNLRLLERLRSKDLLVLGGSFPNWLARFFVRHTRRGRISDRDDQRIDFIVGDRSGLDTRLVAFLTQFSSGTRLFKQPVNEFVEELARRWSDRMAQQELATADEIGSSSDLVDSPDPVFISYPGENLDEARQLHTELTERGIPTWFDKVSLKAGEWKPQIRKAIEECQLFVPLVSKSALHSKRRFLRAEWYYAEQSVPERKPGFPFIVPIRCDDVDVKVEGLPGFLADQQFFDFKSPDRRDLQAVIEAYQKNTGLPNEFDG